MSLALTPLTLLLFDGQPLVSPLANFIAVSVVSMVTVPVLLIGMVLLLLDLNGASLLLDVSGWVLFGVWSWLEWLSQADLMYTGLCPVGLTQAVVASAAGLLLLLPRGVPGKWVGWVLIGALMIPGKPAVGADELVVTVLDVGQGLAVVMRWGDQTWVYDTGPRYPSGFDTGSAVVAPFLRNIGVAHVDGLVISHGDLDHVGGFEGLGASIDVHRVISNVSTLDATEPCISGVLWTDGATRLAVLRPRAQPGTDHNIDPCALKIQHFDAKVLLPGDIESSAERELLREVRSRVLKSDVLIAPYHDSFTSSTAQFVAAVDTSHVVFTVGYRNRYRLPSERVVERYRARGTKLFRTDLHGAVRFRLSPGQAITEPECYRQARRRPWRLQVDDLVDMDASRVWARSDRFPTVNMTGPSIESPSGLAALAIFSNPGRYSKC